MKYFLIIDLGIKIECAKKGDIPKLLNYKSWASLIKENGGTQPNIYEITKKEYEREDENDII